ncbi:hypothetical protein ACP4OV_022306 [Aristida adscensionis]
MASQKNTPCCKPLEGFTGDGQAIDPKEPKRERDRARYHALTDSQKDERNKRARELRQTKMTIPPPIPKYFEESENTMEDEDGSENMMKSQGGSCDEELKLEIWKLKSELAKKEKDWYARENKRLRDEIEHLRKQKQEPQHVRQQPPSFQGTSAAGGTRSVMEAKVVDPCKRKISRAEVIDLTKDEMSVKDEVVAAPGVEPSRSAPNKVEAASSPWVGEYWNTLTDEQKQAAIQLHDASNSSIPVFVCAIQQPRAVHFSPEFFVTYLRSKTIERLSLKAFAANNLTFVADIDLAARKSQNGCLSKGWTYFAKVNGIKVGDICAFQFSDDALSVAVQVIKATKRQDMIETAAGAAATQTVDQSSENPPVAERTRGRAAGVPAAMGMKPPRPKKLAVNRGESKATQCSRGKKPGAGGKKKAEAEGETGDGEKKKAEKRLKERKANYYENKKLALFS